MSKDVKIIKRLKDKSEKYYKLVYYQYSNLIFYLAFDILNNKEDAEDVMQTTFIKFFRNIDYISEESSIKSLLCRICKNEAIDLYRKKANSKEVYNEQLLDNKKDESVDQSKASLLLTLENTLNKQEAHIIALKIIYDFSFQEIAEEINESIGSVQAKYYKAIKKLKKYYKEEIYNEL